MTLADRLASTGARLSGARMTRERTYLDLTVAGLTVSCSGTDLIDALRDAAWWLAEIERTEPTVIDAEGYEMAEAPRWEMGGSD